MIILILSLLVQLLIYFRAEFADFLFQLYKVDLSHDEIEVSEEQSTRHKMYMRSLIWVAVVLGVLIVASEVGFKFNL
jgi:hypothetical protein